MCHVFCHQQSSALFRNLHVSGLLLCFNFFQTLLFIFQHIKVNKYTFQCGLCVLEVKA